MRSLAALWSGWNGDPLLLALIGGTSWLYAAGVRVAWRQAGVGRGLSRRQAACFLAGVVALLLALVSPLDRLAAPFFSMHMVQHMLLVTVAAPLLVLGAPNLAFLWAIPRGPRRALGRWWNGTRLLPALWHGLSHPAAAWGLHTGVFWLWHIPALYQAALAHKALHALEHLSFLATAMLFWWALFQAGVRRRMGYGGALLYLFTAMIQGAILGALITFSPAPWYPPSTSQAAFQNLDPLRDQQLAGLIMWIPGGPLYLALFLLFVARWLRASEEEARRGTPAGLLLAQTQPASGQAAQAATMGGNSHA